MTQLATTSGYTLRVDPFLKLGHRNGEGGRVEKTAGPVSRYVDLRPGSKNTWARDVMILP